MSLTNNSNHQKNDTPVSDEDEYARLNGLFYDVSKTGLSCTIVFALFCTELSFYAYTQINYKYLAIAIIALLLRVVLEIYEQNK